MTGWAFTALGSPAPQGSKKGFLNKKTGRVNITDASKALKPWRQMIVDAAPGGPMLDGPVAMYCVFTLERPKSAPKREVRQYRQPDLDKLVRGVFDSVKDAGLLVDDARVCEFLRLAKVWPGLDPGALEIPGVLVAAVEIRSPTWSHDLEELAYGAHNAHLISRMPPDAEGWG